MPQETPLREKRRSQNYCELLEQTGWYHSFVFPDGTRIEGTISIEELTKRWARFPLPADLSGKRVLDIGAWDGWFSFEAERRGASVVAIDCVEVPNFLEVHRKLGSGVEYRVLDFYEIPYAGLGKFDYVFFLGILYHLKHPLLALEIVCGMATEAVMVESFVCDGRFTWEAHSNEIPTMEFYETDELGGLFDNWFAPSVTCLGALCRAAGFARVERMHVQETYAGYACFRRWEVAGGDGQAVVGAPELLAAVHARTMGINFSTRRSEEYVTIWFRPPVAPGSRFDIQLQVGNFGVPAVYFREDSASWTANFHLPPGLEAGWQEVRVRLAGGEFSAPLRIAVDIPEKAEAIELKAVSDGITWKVGEISRGGHAIFWVRGLPGNSDRFNVRPYAGEIRLKLEYLGEADGDGYRQINTRLPEALGPGIYGFAVELGGTRSNTFSVQVR
jgi:tRNA (mo5U34)-methyltransferase